MTADHGMKPTVVRTLEGLRDYVAEHGRPPTNTELAAHIGIAAGSLGHHLGVLECRGWIRRAGRKPGGRIQLLKPWPPATPVNPSDREPSGRTS